MANKKKNPEAVPTPEQQARTASSSRKKQRKTYVSKTVKIILVVIGFNFIGEGVRDALDPKTKE